MTIILYLLVNNLELLITSVIPSAASNLRGRPPFFASIVKDKLTLRDEVLKVHTGGGFCSHQSGSQGIQLLSADLFWALTNNCINFLILPSYTNQNFLR